MRDVRRAGDASGHPVVKGTAMGQHRPKTVAILLFDGADMLDVGGPTEVFLTATQQLIRSQLATEPVYSIELLSRAGGLVKSDIGVGIDTRPMHSISPSSIDTLLISGGGSDQASRDPQIVDWIRRASGDVRRLGSTCTGAFVLAATGLLDGHNAATHWAHCSRLQQLHPAIRVDSDSIFLTSDNIWTSAGATAGMDMALAMVEEDFGLELALLVARRLVIFLKRPGGQSQFSMPLQVQTEEGPLAPLLRWIVLNPAADLRTDALAERANMSLRSFYRAFVAATGTPPAEWVELARMEVARRLLEQTSLPVERIAVEAGFINYERMRRAFARRTGITPAAYRSRFARTLPPHDSLIDVGLLLSAGDAAPPDGRTRH
jgi:transcriptional regulator GlxA family with amidase domain